MTTRPPNDPQRLSETVWVDLSTVDLSIDAAIDAWAVSIAPIVVARLADIALQKEASRMTADTDEPEDIEELMLELRESMPPPTSREIRGWADRAASAIVFEIPESTVVERPVSDGAHADDWDFTVVTSQAQQVDVFRSDGTFTDHLGRDHRWSDFVEGGPESIGRYLADAFYRHSGTPRPKRSRRPRLPNAE